MLVLLIHLQGIHLKYNIVLPHQRMLRGLFTLKSLYPSNSSDAGKPLGSCCLILKSPIYIGTFEPKLGRTISAAMIRNTENRQYAITFPLVSWLTFPVLSSLLDSKEREKVQLSSGDLVGSFCRLIEMSFFPEDRSEIGSGVSRKLEEKRIKEITEKQFEDWKAGMDKKIESAIEEMKAELAKKQDKEEKT